MGIPPACNALFPKSDTDSPLLFERLLHTRGFSRVAGVDEAGRGPLAGPVVAAAVILGDTLPHGIDDSKRLPPPQRERLHAEIMRHAAAVGVGIVGPDTIDRINILQATFMAMRQALESLSISPDHILVDGNLPIPGCSSQTAVVGGDRRSLSIAAASIVAKVTRDRIMDDLHRLYPDYGFDRHRGYGTRSHREAIARYGVTPVHRRTFAGVREHLPPCTKPDDFPSTLF